MRAPMLLLVVLVGCGNDSTPVDDAGPSDSARLDAPGFDVGPDPDARGRQRSDR